MTSDNRGWPSNAATPEEIAQWRDAMWTTARKKQAAHYPTPTPNPATPSERPCPHCGACPTCGRRPLGPSFTAGYSPALPFVVTC